MSETPSMGDERLYDPAARRHTPLAKVLQRQIKGDGPITVEDYMRRCLLDAEHGYYRTRPVIGRDADFITAPEISQIFGEIIGAWVAVTWQQMGAPDRLRLVELGPGRGTLISDIARVLTRVPPLRTGLSIELVDTSEPLRDEQKKALANCPFPVAWPATLDPSSSDGDVMPTIVLGNEFLDCLAPSFWVKGEDRWARRLVGIDDNGDLQYASEFMPSAGKHIAVRFPDAPVGSVYEEMPSENFAENLARVARIAPLAALFLDYGVIEDGIGDTLQAVRDHRPEHPLTSPGEADLTCHVKFSWYKDDLVNEGFTVDGPVTQAEFLGRLGIIERASRLMDANPAEAHAIETAVARIIAVPGMGDRFKAMGVRSPALPPLAGF